MDMSVRLQLRRLLRSVPGIEVVGQAFEAAQIPQLKLTTHANWLLIDAAGDSTEVITDKNLFSSTEPAADT